MRGNENRQLQMIYLINSMPVRKWYTISSAKKNRIFRLDAVFFYKIINYVIMSRFLYGIRIKIMIPTISKLAIH